MKKIFVSLRLMLAVVSGVSAQSWKDLLGKAAGEVAGSVSSSDTGSAVTNILGTLLGNSLTLSNSFDIIFKHDKFCECAGIGRQARLRGVCP